MKKIFLFNTSIFCIFFFIFIYSQGINAVQPEKGKERILELIENNRVYNNKNKISSTTLYTQNIPADIFVPVLIHTNNKSDTKHILDRGGIEKYKVLKHLNIVYAHINKSTLEELYLDSSTTFFFEDKLYDMPEQPLFFNTNMQTNTPLSSTYTGKDTVVAIIDWGMVDHDFFSSPVNSLDGSTAPRIAHQECYSRNYTHNDSGKVTTLRSLCEDIDGDGAGDEKVVDQSRNPAMHCDTLLTNDCSHGTHVASLISGKRPVGYTAAIPDTTAPDTQIAMFKVSVGSLCVNSVVGDINCNGVEVVTISASSIYFAIDSIIDRKKEYLNGDSDGDPGLNIVALNMSIAGNFIFSSECVETQETGNQVFTASSYIYSTDSNDETLYKYGIAPVVSAGNDRERDGEPIFGCIPRVISVAALNDSFTEVASFSNIAYYTDFIDNGEGVVVAAPGGAFGIINGTSFSSPRVAGHYATLSEKYPSATLDQLTKRLKVSSKLFGDTRINAVHIGARFPQIDIEKALSAKPFIHYDEIPNINIIEDFSSDIYTTTEDSLSLKFLSDTSRAYITSTEHFTGEIDATLEIDLITGDQIFSVDIPLKSEVTSKIIINTVDDLTTNADIVSTDFLIIQQVPIIVTIEGVIGDNVFTQNENIDGEPIATVVLQPGYSALYGLTTLKRECSDTSITYTQDIPLIGDITLENGSYYRFCVTASHATNVDYTTFTDFLVWHDRDVTGVISDGLLSLDEYNKNIPITDIESLTDYTDTFALTDTSTECDESLTYDTEIYTSENSLFTDSSVQRLCIKASSNFEKSLYTKKDFTVDLKLNVFIVRLKLPRTIVITLNADITSIQETNGDGGFVLTNTSAFSLTPSSYAADKNKIILTFSSDISDDSTLAFTKGSPTLFSSGAVTLESFTSLDVLGFTLDFDLSGDYKSSKDGLFLYLYTQTAYTLNDTALEQFIDGESSLETIKNNIDYYINNQLLDFDLSGEYKSSKDGLFLYIYTQTAYILNDTALEQFIDFNSSLEDTKEKINSSIPT